MLWLYYRRERQRHTHDVARVKNTHYTQQVAWSTLHPEVFSSLLDSIPLTHPDIVQWKEHIHSHVVGLDGLIHTLCVGLLTWTHVLIEWVPGLAKTKTVHVLAQLLDVSYKRIQFTPDMLPSDITGSEVYHPETKTFDIVPWPIFAHIVLADEINRSTPKVQAALLEAMQEQQVTIWGKTLPLPSPFFVLATQNPLEQEGTYVLPEAQVDRFLCKVLVTYPSADQEQAMVRMLEQTDTERVEAVMSSADELLAHQARVKKVTISDALVAYIVRLVDATRQSSWLRYGASPRASLAMVAMAKALAYMADRSEVEVGDIHAAAVSVLRHRVSPTYQAGQEVGDVDRILQRLLSTVPLIG